MNLEITGKLIEKYETQTVSDRFKKREFVLELVEEVNGSPYTNYAKMQLVQNKCDILDRFNVGDTLRVNFNIKGNRYEKEGRTSYFSNLDAWRLEKADMNAPQTQNQGQNTGGGYNQGNSGNFGNGNSGGNWGNSNSNFQNNPAPAQGNTATESADDLPF
jgi:hypothetical protein